MALVAPINLPFNVRTLWFDPNGIEVHAGDKVVVQTVRGLELGVAASDNTEVDDESIKKLKSPLKPVIRIATEEDILKSEEMQRLGREAMPVFKEMAHEANENMHPVSVEYLLDGDKAIFYFEAEERIDFRELVRKLASHFHVRIDMHQIGVRDEARIVGGLAHCGQEVCCKRLGGEFNPVSIRMAKDQDLSLNPQKISGLCGRLMCCLRYENEAYVDFKSRAPKVGSKVKTPDGEAKVTSLDVPKEIVTVQIEGEPQVKVPLSAFKKPKEGKRPDVITDAGWQQANEPEEIVFETAGIFSTSNFTGTDKLGSAKAIHNPTRSKARDKASSAQAEKETAAESHRKQRKRRSRVIKGGAASTEGSTEHISRNDQSSDKKSNTKPSTNKSRSAASSNNKDGSKPKLRPGHRSSGLSQEKTNDQNKKSGQRSGSKNSNSERSGDKAQNPNRRRRRRRSSQKPTNEKGDN